MKTTPYTRTVLGMTFNFWPQTKAGKPTLLITTQYDGIPLSAEATATEVELTVPSVTLSAKDYRALNQIAADLCTQAEIAQQALYTESLVVRAH